MAEYITKKAAINAVENAPIELFKSEWEEIEEAINAAPAADVAPVVHGRWKLLHAGDWTSVCVCSVCGRRETVASSDMCNPEDHMSKIYPFCHCGAKMDGGADNG